MNLALSSPNVLVNINSPANASALAAAIVTAMLEGGWTLNATISGGVTLLGTSPQSYTVLCDVTVSGTTITIQLHSNVGSSRGYAHSLEWLANENWQVIAHPCGFAIARPDNGGTDSAGSTVMGGIPYLSTSCGVAAALGTVTEVWFSFGDGKSGQYANCPRNSIDVGSQSSSFEGNQTGCFNGVMAVSSGGSSVWDVPEILRFSTAAPDASGLNPFPLDSHPLFFGETPMTYPAYIAWPDATGGGPIKIRGQIYNAAVRSQTQARNTTAFFLGLSWINFTDSYYWGSLWLCNGSVVPSSGVLGNVAF